MMSCREGEASGGEEPATVVSDDCLEDLFAQWAADPFPDDLSIASVPAVRTTRSITEALPHVRQKRVKTSRRPVKQNKFLETNTTGHYALVSLKPTLFPKFEKTEFLLFLPTVISKCFNCGDFEALRRALNPRASKDCVVDVCSVTGLSGVDYVSQFFESLLAVHPDNICVPHGIHRQGSNVSSRIVFKATSVKSLHDRLIADSGMAFPLDRMGYLDKMDWTDKSDEDMRSITALLASDADLVLNAVGNLSICFDVSKRIRKLELHCVFTSIRLARYTVTE